MMQKILFATLLAGASAFAPPAAFGRQSTALSNQKVNELIAEQLGVDIAKVVPDAKFIDDLEADSLDTVELIMAIEEEFDCEIPEEEAAKITTVGEVIAFVDNL